MSEEQEYCLNPERWLAALYACIALLAGFSHADYIEVMREWIIAEHVIDI